MATYRHAAEISIGLQAALSNNDLPFAWSEANSTHGEEFEVKELHFDTNSERALARAMAANPFKGK